MVHVFDVGCRSAVSVECVHYSLRLLPAVVLTLPHHVRFGCRFPAGPNPTSALPIANNWSSLAMFLVLSRWGKNWSVQKRLYGSIFVCFLMLALVPTINLTGSPFPQTTRVWMTLGLCFVAGTQFSALFFLYF